MARKRAKAGRAVKAVVRQAPEPAADTPTIRYATAAMARNNWPGDFKRAVYQWAEKDGKRVRGDVIETLVFPPGVPVKLTAEQFEAVKDDIGKSLVEVEFDEKERPRVIDPSPPPEHLLTDERAELEATIVRQQAAIDSLCTQVRALGAEPIVELEGDVPAEHGESAKRAKTRTNKAK
jgi:hypothetical protein